MGRVSPTSMFTRLGLSVTEFADGTVKVTALLQRPSCWILATPLTALRFGTDLGSFALDQAVMADFIEQGALSRHLRRMREIYGERLRVLHDSCSKYLKGRIELSHVQAGLFTPAFLRNGMTSRQAEEAAAARGLESMGLHRFSLQGRDHKGLLLGFGAFDEKSIQQAVISLVRVLG